MRPDFLKQERKTIPFFRRIDQEKKTKKTA